MTVCCRILTAQPTVPYAPQACVEYVQSVATCAKVGKPPVDESTYASSQWSQHEKHGRPAVVVMTVEELEG